MEVVVAALVLLGAAFVAVAALGLLRLPDLYARMHAAAKAGTLGCGLVLVAVALSYPSVSVVLRAVGAVAFLLATAPVAGHLIGRAAHRTGVPMAPGTVCDERDAPAAGVRPPSAAPTRKGADPGRAEGAARGRAP